MVITLFTVGTILFLSTLKIDDIIDNYPWIIAIIVSAYYSIWLVQLVWMGE